MAKEEQWSERKGMENTSGQRGPVPAELAGVHFHFGALFWGGIWALAHGIYWAAVPDVAAAVCCASIPLVMLFLGDLAGGLMVLAMLAWLAAAAAIRLYLAFKGPELAWQYRMFAELTEFRAVQRMWNLWAIVCIAVLLGLLAFPSLLPNKAICTPGSG